MTRLRGFIAAAGCATLTACGGGAATRSGPGSSQDHLATATVYPCWEHAKENCDIRYVCGWHSEFSVCETFGPLSIGTHWKVFNNTRSTKRVKVHYSTTLAGQHDTGCGAIGPNHGSRKFSKADGLLMWLKSC
jgi:hypothetical protein